MVQSIYIFLHPAGPISPKDFLISEDLDGYESDKKKKEIPIKAQKFFFNEGTRKRRYLNVGKIENTSKERSKKILEDDSPTGKTSDPRERSKILREDPNWIEDPYIEISEDESDDESESSENEEDETDNDKTFLLPMSL